MIFLHFLNWIIIIPLIILGIVVFTKGRKTTQNITFSLFIFSILIWTFTNYFADISKIEEQALLWSRLTIIGPAFIPAFFFHFTWVFTKKNIKKGIYLFFIYIIPIIITGLTFTNYNIQNVQIKNWGVEVEPGSLYYVLFLYLSISFLWSTINLIIYYRNIHGSQKLQTLYILIGFSISAFFGIFTNLFLLLIGNARYTSFGPLSALILAFFVSIAIIKHRLMGIRFIFNKAYIYTIVAAFAYLTFYIITIIENFFWGNVFSPKSMIMGAIFAICFAFIILPLIEKVQHYGDIFFFKGKNPRKRIKEILISLNNAFELREIYDIIVSEFNKVIGIPKKNISILVDEEGKKSVKKFCVNKKCSLNHFDINEKKALIKKLIQTKKILAIDEIEEEENKIKKEMKEIKTSVILPLTSRKKLIGLIILGNKKNNEGYSLEDFEFFSILKTQVSASIENALLYREVKNFNKTLKTKVDQQTKQLKDQNKHLEELLKIRGDFLNIASHQLRTPVTVIKGMTNMILKGSVPKEKQKSFIEGIHKKSQKLSEIIHDILSASEMDTRSFDLKVEPISLNELIDQIYEEKRPQAEKKQLKLVKQNPKKDIIALGNFRYLLQAIGNIINNSIRYTSEGKITLKLESDGKYAKIKVTDTGIGIPKKDIPKLFDKFVRSENAVKFYTDGSGLGLFIVKKIIEAHKDANVHIEKSELNKGTTVTVKLPKTNKKVIKK